MMGTHNHKPHLLPPKVPSLYQESPEDVLGSLPDNQSTLMLLGGQSTSMNKSSMMSQDGHTQEVYYSFSSSSGQDGWDQFSLDDCSDLIGCGPSLSINYPFDHRNQKWFPLSSTPVTGIDPDAVGLV